ncbi:lamin tail domain-containing protein [Algoriphagus halophilus]|uniref:Lamin Tail Domain n=1 Tax=Algoriphagus halophilus TaxID=226505 RepID=A0A1N6FQN1_9BACT|nr:lamin tail domain-containing protein [Algoriphagus halophilus]SIN97574.1 Lamin Tail Domain [Algoriphagus halophilus]
MSEVHAQTQAFELDFNPVSFPSQFLPGWYGNEVRNSSSRIFQGKDHGVNQSHALAVQPISTFNGELIVRLSVSEFTAPKIQFLAKSSKNGNGSRAAEVYSSWSNSLNENFLTPQVLGSLVEFPNEEQEFRLFEIHIPDQFQGSDLLYFKLEVRYGTGAGTSARWFMDDFVFGDIAEDTVPPTVQMVRGFSENEIQMLFSEAIDPVFSIIQLNYKLDGQEPELVRLDNDSLAILTFSNPLAHGKEINLHISQIPELSVDTVYLSGPNTLKLELKSAATKSIEYGLNLSSILDCAGNGLETPIATVILPASPLGGDVVINELLFNPQSGRPKFVELYNRSSNYLEIGGLQLGNLDANGLPGQLKKISESGFIFPPQSYLAITTDTILLQQDFPKSSNGNFLQVSTLPSYPISGGTVVLLSEEQELLEEFSFDEEMHHPLLRDPKGVSLERISINVPSNLKSNWHSASGLEDYGTPGKKNSNSFTGEFESQLITISPEVFDPEGNNGNTLTVISYELDQPGWVGAFEIYDVGGRIAKVLDRNAILGNSGMYNWSGTDDSGRKVRPGYYVLLVELFDLQGEVIRFRKTMVVATQF